MGTFVRATTVTALGALGAHRRRKSSRLGCLAVVVLLSVLGGTVAASPAAGQATDSDIGTRIVARKLESGRIEFGLQQRQGDSSWGDRQLPRVRFFPTTATVGRWLASSALDLPVGDVRIVARKLETGRIEFGLQQRQGDGSWGDRQLPRGRVLPHHRDRRPLARQLITHPHRDRRRRRVASNH